MIDEETISKKWHEIKTSPNFVFFITRGMSAIPNDDSLMQLLEFERQKGFRLICIDEKGRHIFEKQEVFHP
jgi:hypothetical protein